VNYLLPGEREKELQGGVERGKSGGSQGAFALAQPVKKTHHPMSFLQILEQVRARQRGEAAYAFMQTEEGKAMALELDRLQADVKQFIATVSKEGIL